MRIGWSIPLPGPFRVSGTVWRSPSKRRPGYHGTLPGWRCPHNHSRMDLAVACANRHARSPEYRAQQAARARQAAEREARQQARAAEREAARLRARLDRCIAAAAGRAIAAVAEHGGTLPGKRRQRSALANAAGQVIRHALMTTELATEDMAGLENAAQAVAEASGGPVLAAVTEHGGTLPPAGERGLTEFAVRGAIRQQLVAGFPRENLADGGGSPDPGQAPQDPDSRRRRRGAGVIVGGVVFALVILLIGLAAGSPDSSTPTAAPSPVVTAPVSTAPAHTPPATVKPSPVKPSPVPSHTAKSAPKPAHTQAPATQAPAPAYTPAQAPAPAYTPSAAPVTHRAGEFCGEHGMTDAAGLTCTLYPSGTWHWKH
jgi:hypothetical protein